VTRYEWGTLYLVQPDWNGPEDRLDLSVVEAYERSKSSLDVARELWRLAGNEERAANIDRLLELGYSRPRRFINGAEIDALLEDLEGLEDALIGTVVDDEGKLSPEQLPDLRRTTKTLWLDESRGDLAIWGVEEAMQQVQELREILLRAKELGLNVSFA
jgi:hypothetical protein